MEDSLVDQFFDRVYYINLDKDTRRNQHMLDTFKQFNIKKYTRIPGVIIDHKDVNPLFYRNMLEKSDERYYNGSLGCRAAHLHAILDAKHNKYERILLLEDDINFHIDPNDLIAGNINNITDYWDFLYFGGLEEMMFRGQIILAHAIGISYKIFDDIIMMAESSGMEIDNFYGKIMQQMSHNHRHGGQIVTKKIQPFNTVYQNRSFRTNIQFHQKD